MQSIKLQLIFGSFSFIIPNPLLFGGHSLGCIASILQFSMSGWKWPIQVHQLLALHILLLPGGLPLDFSKLPEDWRYPTWGTAQSYFTSKNVEDAGFAQYQQFGLGGNSLTGGQKSALIFGSLLFLFILFLSGYFIQLRYSKWHSPISICDNSMSLL